MIEIIRERKYCERHDYYRFFRWRCSSFHDGYSFDCDRDGNVLPFRNDTARKSYQACISGVYDVIDEGVHVINRSGWEPAAGRCQCGAEVELASYTNTCERCGRDYNWAGQELAPRRFWGEETGETADEILNGVAEYEARRNF